MKRRPAKTRLEFCSVCLDRKRPEILRGGVCPTCRRDLQATAKPTGAWTSNTGAPRWGKASKATQRKRQEWAERVGTTAPTPLRKCKPCGGWATRDCQHGRGDA